jgi:hypothetical protein
MFKVLTRQRPSLERAEEWVPQKQLFNQRQRTNASQHRHTLHH